MAETLGVRTILDSRYEIIRHLGGGGFGQTYVAEDLKKFRESCLVKQLQPRFSDPGLLENARRRFNQEAITLQRLGNNHEQIPRLLAYFEEDAEFYLVMDFIEGKPLSVRQGWTEDEVVSLLQDILKILQFVHENNVIHRDIKPSNVIRRESDGKIFLIDFGAVKEVTILKEESPGIDPDSTVSIGTPGYMPKEQSEGNPCFCSDIYALGMLGIHLLTKESPRNLNTDPSTSEVIWNTREASPELAEVLGKMVRYNFTKRYQTVTKALEALQQLPTTSRQASGDTTIPIPGEPEPPSNPVPPEEISTKSEVKGSDDPPPLPLVAPIPPIIPVPPRGNFLTRLRRFSLTMTGKVLGFLTIAAFAVVVAVSIPKLIPSQAQPDLSNRFSLGEKILIKADMNSQKEEAAKAFAKGDFKTAIEKLESSLVLKKNDPEALIYLNNAKAAQKGKTFRIAVSVPIDGKNFGIDQEMLRGVAQSQNDWNNSRGSGGTMLQVKIANDDNNEEIAKEIAQELVKDQQISAVVGHNASEVSIAAAPIYNNGGLVMVSPTSGASQLSDKGKYIFRTVPSVDVDAKNLAPYAIETARKRKFAMCIDRKSPYSTTLASAFKKSVQKAGGQSSDIPCEFSDSAFDAVKFIKDAKNNGVDGLLVTPSVERMEPAIQLVKNREGLAIFGGSTMYSYDILDKGKKDAEGMVLAVAWHSEATPGNGFPISARNLWGAEVNWRTAMSYDATQAIVEALVQSGNDRKKLRDELARINANGATGNIAFTDLGDRKLEGGGLGILVKVEQRPGTANKYKFSYLDPAKVVPPS